MKKLAIGDLVYDFKYIGMIIASDLSIPMYRIEWYVSDWSELDRIDDASQNRAERFRKRYLDAREKDSFKSW